MPENKIHSEDDVNLAGVRAILVDLLRIFFEILAFLGSAIRKNKFFITLFFVIGIALGYGYRASRSSLYKATMIVQFNKLNKRTYAEMVEQLNHLISFGQPAVLAHELAIPETTTARLLSIEALDMEDRDLSADTSTKVDQPFKIVVAIRDESVIFLDSLQAGVIHYLNYSPLLTRLAQETQSANELKLQIIDGDLLKLDTLKREYNRFLSSTRITATFYNNAANPADFYTQTLTLLTQREIALRELKVNVSPVVVVDALKISSGPKSASLLMTILFGVAAALLAILIATLLEARKRVMMPARSDANPIVNVNPPK